MPIDEDNVALDGRFMLKSNDRKRLKMFFIIWNIRESAWRRWQWVDV